MHQDQALRRIRELFLSGTALFALDFDGTLVPTKNFHVDVSPETHQLLQTVKESLVIVTDRDIEPKYGIDHFLNDKSIRVIGGQGAQIRAKPHHPVILAGQPIEDEIVKELELLAATHEGVEILHKPHQETPLGIWLNYGQVENPAVVGSAIDRLMKKMLSAEQPESGYRYVHDNGFFGMVEKSLSKLGALQKFIAQEGLENKTLIAAGDTMSDAPMLHYAKEKGGIALAVGSRIPDADLYFDTSAQLVDFLDRSVSVSHLAYHF